MSDGDKACDQCGFFEWALGIECSHKKEGAPEGEQESAEGDGDAEPEQPRKRKSKLAKRIAALEKSFAERGAGPGNGAAGSGTAGSSGGGASASGGPPAGKAGA